MAEIRASMHLFLIFRFSEAEKCQFIRQEGNK